MLAAADVHVTVQRRAASDLVMPSKLTNILAAGRPTVATADRGTTLWDVLEGSEAGRCTPPEDPAAFAEALRKLGEDSTMRERLGRNARFYAEIHLNQDVVLQQFERQLLSLIAAAERHEGASEAANK
jgi:colanic acid biosynthesis glycosyl transferase WcaI